MFSHHHASRQLCCSPTWLLSGGLLLGVLLALSQAQVPTAIRPDGTLGTAVTQSGNIYNITGGTRPGNGRNLFHSFDRFSVGTNDTASFSGPTGIENILSRVTGGQQSVIDGRLQSTIPGANLYLLNPSGVLFGPNATLDVSGSFHVSTADFLRFTDGAKFSANLGQESTLTVAPPVAFGFLGSPPAPITIRGSALQVPEGKALSVVGGDITIMGNGSLTNDSLPTLRAPGGRLQLVSVASPGEVVFSPPELAPDLGVDSFAQLGRLEFSHGAFLDASGNGGGLVLLRGRSLRVEQSWLFADNTGPLDGTGLGLDIQITADALIMGGADLANRTYLTADSLRAGRARDLRLTAGNLRMDNAIIGSSPSSSGGGGNVTLHVGSLTLTGGAQISTSTFGVGHGGDLSVVATDAVSLAGHKDNFPSGLFSRATARGDAGSLRLQVGRLSLTDGAQISTSTSGAGRGGDMEVRAGTLRMDGGRISADTLADGNGGNIDMRVGQLTLLGGAQISNSSGLTQFINGVPTFIGGQGQGGTLTVVATESISIAGQDSEGFRSGLFSNTNGSGNAGSLFISTPLLSMDGGRILTRTLGDGNAGDIEIKTGRLTLIGGAQIFSGIGDIEAGAVRGIQGPGRGGKVTVSATESIVIAGRDSEGFLSAIASNAQIGRGQGGRIFIATPNLEMRDGFISTGTSNLSTGDAGSIDIQVGRLTLTGGAQIITGTRSSGRGGTLTVAATDMISIAGRDQEGNPSGLFSNTQSRGQGGNLHVQARTIELRASGAISASSSGEGAAGTIQIQADETFRSHHGQVTTTAEQAGGGTIVLRAGRLVQLRDSELTTTVRGGGGDAGNLTVDAPFIVAGGSQLVANAFGGRGGNIRLVAEVFLADPESRVSASSTLGVAGTVDIRAPVTNLSGVVSPLPPDFAPAAALLRDRCAARLREGAVSSFVERGRDGVPATPEGVLPSRLYSGSAGAAGSTSETAVSERRVSRPDDNGHVQVRRRPAPKGSALAREPECAAR